MYLVDILGGTEVKKRVELNTTTNYQCHYLKHEMLLPTQSDGLHDIAHQTYQFQEASTSLQMNLIKYNKYLEDNQA